MTITALTGKPAVRLAADWVVPDGNNGADPTNAATLNAYDPATDVPFATVGGSNVAMVKLAAPLITNTELAKSNFFLYILNFSSFYQIYSFFKAKANAAIFVKATDFTTFNTAYGANYRIRVCGFGVIDNKGTKAKNLMCTDMTILDSGECANSLPTAVNMPTDGTAVCLRSNSDSNVCPGDYGGTKFLFQFN